MATKKTVKNKGKYVFFVGLDQFNDEFDISRDKNDLGYFPEVLEIRVPKVNEKVNVKVVEVKNAE